VALFSDISTFHDSFFIPNYNFYQIDRFPGAKDENAIAARKGIPRNHVHLHPLVLVEATGVCIPIENKECILAAVYKSPHRTWVLGYADIVELLKFRHKSLLAGDLNAKHPFETSAVLRHSGEKLLKRV
jgi:hypothetical protein